MKKKIFCNKYIFITSAGAQNVLIRRSETINLRCIDLLKYRRALSNSLGISPIFIYLFIYLFADLFLYLKKTCTDIQMKFYKVVARKTLFYGSESWVITTRDMTRLEAAEMRFLRSVERYRRLDKIRSEVIRKELEISGIQDVRSKRKQNWINHLERMDNTRLPKHALNYKPRGRRDRGRPSKRWQCVDAGTGQTT